MDFSSFLLQAQASKANVSVWQCRWRHHQLHQAGFRIGIAEKRQKLAGLLMSINDVHCVGLKTATIST